MDYSSTPTEIEKKSRWIFLVLINVESYMYVQKVLVEILNTVEITLKRREKSLVINASIRDEYVHWKKILEAILQSI